ncbi:MULTISPECIES: hypothetical protein [Pandoraea]|nr:MULTISPECIES: hypothetical protein [Pandoraea]
MNNKPVNINEQDGARGGPARMHQDIPWLPEMARLDQILHDVKISPGLP